MSSKSEIIYKTFDRSKIAKIVLFSAAGLWIAMSPIFEITTPVNSKCNVYTMMSPIGIGVSFSRCRATDFAKRIP
jgi:hypothetical protein